MEIPQNMLNKNRTAASIIYLLMAFPLGLIYFIFLVTGLSLGLGTLIIWIGIPILLLTMLGARGMAALERDLAEHMLHIPMPHPARIVQPKRSLHAWAMATISDALTWRSIIYVLIKFPIGIITFTLALTLPLLALGFLFEPLIYLLNTFIAAILLEHGIHATQSWMPFFVMVDGHFDPTMFLRSCIGTPLGIIGWYLSSQALNGIAYGLGLFARAMLSPTQEEIVTPKSEPYNYMAMEMR